MEGLRAFLVKKTKLKHSSIERPTQLLHFLGFVAFVFCSIYSLVIFTIYKKIAELLMTLRHGKDFHGFVPNSDAIFTVEKDEWRTIVVGVAYVKSRGKIDVLEKVKKCFREKVFDHPEMYRKLTSTYDSFMGYVYFKYDTYTLDDCVKPIKLDRNADNINDSDLKRFIQENGNSPFPKNGCGTLEVFVGQKPMENTSDDKDGTYIYPVILKVHHIIGDGSALFALLTKILADDPEACENLLMDKIKLMTKLRANTPWEFLVNYVMNLMKQIYQYASVLYLAGGSLYYIFSFRKHDENALHGPQLSGKKVVGWVKEDKVELIPMVKRIKNTVPNTTFSDVIYTAITASIINYFKRNSCAIPDHLSIAVSLVMSFRNLGKSGSASMENNIGLGMMDVACDEKDSLLQTLDKIRDQYAFLKTVPDTQASYLLLNTLVRPFPLPLIADQAVFNAPTTGITNIPGGPKIKVLDGCELDALIPILPNRGKVGICFGILSYDDRFNFGVFGDSALITSIEIQKIADDIVKNIRLLEQEVKAQYSQTC